MTDHEVTYRMGDEKVPASGMKKWHNDPGIPWGDPYEGPDPVTIRKMARPNNMNVHLGNEHGLAADDSDDPLHGVSVAHLLAHAYARFRPGQEHYHEDPRKEETT